VSLSENTLRPYSGRRKLQSPSDKEKQKDCVMRKLTPTLTQSGLLAVLLRRQRYAVIQLARRQHHPLAQRNAFRRRDARRQSRSFARWNQSTLSTSQLDEIRMLFRSASAKDWKSSRIDAVR
jgi:hypothetical protein